MHYQRGIAIASGKPTLIVHSADADPRFWSRTPRHDQIIYWDLDFAGVTLREIDAYCEKYFVEDSR